MLHWLPPALIALAVAALLVRALWRPAERQGLSAAASDIAVYRDQLAEVDRDLARGVLTKDEAETVRTEVSRRLLDADRRAAGQRSTGGGNAALAALVVVAAVIAGSFLLYAAIGAPGYADLPMGERIARIEDDARARISQDEAEARARQFLPQPVEPGEDFAQLMERLRAALAERPNDIQGLKLLSENEARLGNFTAAREAQERVVAAYGADAPLEERVTLLDLMVFVAGGFVSPEAEAVLAGILNDAPQNETARYYAGLTLAQNGRPDRAFPIWRRLLETSEPDAPWVPVIRAEIGGLAAAAGVEYTPPPLRGPDAGDIAAASDMSAEDREEMVRGMVDGLADRLATDGGPPEDWVRLITSLGVLGEVARARAIADEALTVFASDPDAVADIRAARETLAE